VLETDGDMVHTSEKKIIHSGLCFQVVINWDLNVSGRVWTGFIWLRIGISGRVL